MSLIRRALGLGFGLGSVGADPWAIPSNGSVSNWSSAGIAVDENSMLGLLTVTACVRIISETLSNMPLHAVRESAETSVRVNPTPTIVADPFGGNSALSGVTRKEGLAQLAVSALLRGNGYAAVLATEPETALPARLMVLSPDLVGVGLDDGGQRTYSVNGRAFPPARMLHITGMTLPGMPVGLSVLDYARRTIGLGLAAEEYGARFFAKGAHMSGIIKVPGDLPPNKARELKENFESKHSGLSNSHAVGVLTGGAEFAPISITPEDAQFLGTRAAQSLDIAMLYGVPPHMLGQVDRTTSWGKGIEEQTFGFLKFTMAAWVQRFEDAWSAMITGCQAKFDLASLLRPDTTARFSAYMAARNAAILTPNEIRKREDMPPIDGGDDLFAPLNSAHTTDPGWTPDEPEPDDTAAPPAAEPSQKGAAA